MPLPNHLIERFSFGGRKIAPSLSASLTAIPDVHNGLVTSWTIRPWTVVIGEEAGQS